MKQNVILKTMTECKSVIIKSVYFHFVTTMFTGVRNGS